MVRPLRTRNEALMSLFLNRKKNTFRHSALRAAILAGIAASGTASADTYHYQGDANNFGQLGWSIGPVWFENLVPGWTDDAIMNAIPYDNNWIGLDQGQGVQVANLTVLRGNWKFGAIINSSIEVEHDFVIGDYQNPEQNPTYHQAIVTIDPTGLTFNPNYIPQYGYGYGYTYVHGATVIGKSMGSDGTLNLINSETNPSLTTNDLFVGVYGKGTLNLTAASAIYNNMYVGAGQGSEGTLNVDGAPSMVYHHWYGNTSSLDTPFLFDSDTPFKTVIGGQGVGTVALKNGATANLGLLTLGQYAGSNGTLTAKDSSIQAWTIDIGMAGKGSLSLDNSSLKAVSPYLSYKVPLAGTITMQGEAGAVSSLTMINHSSLTGWRLLMGTDTQFTLASQSTINVGSMLTEGANVTLDNSSMIAVGVLIGQEGSSTVSTLTVQDDAQAQYYSWLRLGDSGVVSVFTGGTILLGYGDFGPTTPGHLQVSDGGTLGGRGLINATVDNTGGTIDPGFSPGTLHINGDFNMTGGLIDLQIGGTTPGIGYDSLDVTGNLTITGGTILFEDYNGYVPTSTSLMNFFHAGHLFIGPGVVFDDETGYRLNFNPTTGQGHFAPGAVPEPTSFLAIGVGLAGLGLRRKKRNRRS